MGEFMASIIGWDLVLEYAMGASTVGVGWSGYFVGLLENVNIRLPAALTSAPFRWCEASEVVRGVAGCGTAGLNPTRALLYPPPIALRGLMSVLLGGGGEESAGANKFISALQLPLVALCSPARAR